MKDKELLNYQEREKELRSLNDQKLVSEANKEVLSKHLEDKKIASTEEFKEEEKKLAGASTGYISDRKADKQKFMLKHAFRRPNNAISEQEVKDRRDLVNEFITAPLYKRFLSDQAPVIQLVNKKGELVQAPNTQVITIRPDSIEDDIYIRSKFFKDFQTLGRFSGDLIGNLIARNPTKMLKEIERFEKVMAASLILGELDYHPGNIGVVTRKNEKDKDYYEAVKIDHGRSALDTFSSEPELRKAMVSNFGRFGYFEVNGQTRLPFRAGKLKESIDEMLKISEDEIKNFVQNRVHLLKQAGFDFKGINFAYFEDMEKTIQVNCEEAKDVADLYINRLLKHIVIMKEFSNTLEIIEKLDNAPENIKNGDWLKNLGSNDPILWAEDKGYKIEGKDPIVWAIDKKRKIDGKDAILWAKEKGYKIGGKDHIVRAIGNNQKIEEDPVVGETGNTKKNAAIKSFSDITEVIKKTDAPDVI